MGTPRAVQSNQVKTSQSTADQARPDLPSAAEPCRVVRNPIICVSSSLTLDCEFYETGPRWQVFSLETCRTGAWHIEDEGSNVCRLHWAQCILAGQPIAGLPCPVAHHGSPYAFLGHLV